MLFLVATPIGNLKDITLRALEVLREVDGIICEDSRRTSILLNHYQIKKPLLVLNDFNESKIFPEIFQKLSLGQNLALVSDAGTPLIADPGYKLVRECILKGISTDSIPGPTSIITALTISGLPPSRFLNLGWLPEKPGHRKAILQKLLKIPELLEQITFIVLVSPYKLVKTLSECSEIFGDIEVCLAKELTKIHQTVKKQKLSDWLEEYKEITPRGEYILMFNLRD